jgi:hypothetical protein
MSFDATFFIDVKIFYYFLLTGTLITSAQNTHNTFEESKCQFNECRKLNVILDW